METVLITGASGFVGFHLVEEAIFRRYKVIPVSRKNVIENIDVKKFFFDLRNKEEIRKVLLKIISEIGNIDYIIHNAGITKAKKLNDFYEINYLGTVNFVDALKEIKVEPKKFVYISSLAVMGPCLNGTNEPMTLEHTPLYSKTKYGKSKYLAEMYIKQHDFLNWLIFRPTGIYGPRDKDYFELIKTINKGIYPIVGLNKKYLTFIYVKDLTSLIFDSLKTTHKYKTYFVTDGNLYTYDEFIKILKRILKKKTIKIFLPKFIFKIIAILNELIHMPFNKLPVINRDKYFLLVSDNWNCDISLTVKDFNYKPKYDLEKGLSETIMWLKNNNWLK